MSHEDELKRTGPITHEEADEMLSRFNSSHWMHSRPTGREHARYTIPADPRRDDDIRLGAYIEQSRRVYALASLLAKEVRKNNRIQPDELWAPGTVDISNRLAVLLEEFLRPIETNMSTEAKLKMSVTFEQIVADIQAGRAYISDLKMEFPKDSGVVVEEQPNIFGAAVPLRMTTEEAARARPSSVNGRYFDSDKKCFMVWDPIRLLWEEEPTRYVRTLVEMKEQAQEHFHGDAGMFFSTSSLASADVTLWQCACGFRVFAPIATTIDQMTDMRPKGKNSP